MYLFGASGHAKVVIESLKGEGIEVAGVFDDDPKKKYLGDIEVIGDHHVHNELTNPCIITIGNNQIRKSIVGRIKATYTNGINQSSVISKSVEMGVGTVIMASATINADTIIGNHVIINTSSSIDHDCIIGDFVHVAPNATLCGGIDVGEGTLIGAGAVVLPNVKIGEWCVIGAGSVVNIDLPDNSVAVGNPVRIIK